MGQPASTLGPSPVGRRSVIASLRQPTTPGRADQGLRLLLDGAIDYAIIMLGLNGMVLTWSAGAARILGYQPSEIIGQDLVALYPDEPCAEALARRALACAREEGRFEQQGWLARADGSRLWANQAFTPLVDSAGRRRGFGLVARDLTERIRGLELLAVLDAASDAILGVDPDGRVMFLNYAAERVFGFRRDELLGQPVEVLVPPHTRARHPAYRERYYQDPRPRPMGGGLKLSAARKDGSLFPAEVSLSSVSTQWGRITTVTVRDLSQPPPRHPED